MAYGGTVELVDGIKPKNNGSWPLVNAHDVYVDDENRLDDVISSLGNISNTAYKNLYRITGSDDLDLIDNNCVVSVAGGASNIPHGYPSDFETGAGIIITSLFLDGNTNYRTQMAIKFNAPFLIKIRSMQNGIWNEWSDINNTDTDDKIANIINSLGGEDFPLINAENVSINDETLPVYLNNLLNDTYSNLYKITASDDLDLIDNNCVVSIANGTANIPHGYPSDFGTGAGIVITTIYLSDKKYRMQFAIKFNSPTYIAVRNMTNNVWGEWYRIDKENLNETFYSNLYRVTASDDLDLIDTNCVVSVAGGASNIPNGYPSDFGTSAGIIITTNYLPDKKYRMQFAITFNSPTYIAVRNMTYNVWGEWYRIDNENLNAMAYTNMGTSVSSGLTDIDNVTTNSVYQISIGSAPLNWPFGNDGGELITNIFSGTNFLTQTAIPYNTNKTQLLAFRKKQSGAWSDWDYIKTVIRNHSKKYYAFGDSTTWGYSSDHDHAQSPYNYPACVGKLIDIEVNNLADPGQGLIKDWSVGTEGNFAIIPALTEMINNGDFDDVSLITVGWAYNDAAFYSTVNFGNPSDPIPTSTTGIETWLGHYAKVLDILQTAAPKAMVILITGFGRTSNTEGHKADDQYTHSFAFKDGNKTVKEMYDALETMANINGYYCINQSKGGAITRANASTIIGDNIHPTYDNYRIYGNYVASRIVSLFNNL